MDDLTFLMLLNNLSHP